METEAFVLCMFVLAVAFPFIATSGAALAELRAHAYPILRLTRA